MPCYKYEDLSGKTFHKLTAISRGPDKLWKCSCACGGIRSVPANNLKNGHAKHCGCEKRVKVMVNGWSESKEYKAWVAARDRCSNPKSQSFKDYGGRGIKMCKEWDGDFFAFLKHIGPSPSRKHTLDRHPDNDGNYKPGNVRWATTLEQNNGRRGLTSVQWKGKQYTITRLAKLVKLPRYVLNERLRHGWSIEDSINTPYAPTIRKGIPKHNHFITYQGVKRTITEWGAITGLLPITIHRRLRVGRTVKDALTAPIGIRQQKQL